MNTIEPNFWLSHDNLFILFWNRFCLDTIFLLIHAYNLLNKLIFNEGCKLSFYGYVA